MSAFDLVIAVKRDPAEELPGTALREEAAARSAPQLVVATIDVSGNISEENVRLLMQRIDELFAGACNSLLVRLNDIHCERAVLEELVRSMRARRAAGGQLGMLFVEPDVYAVAANIDGAREVLLPLGAAKASVARRTIDTRR